MCRRQSERVHLSARGERTTRFVPPTAQAVYRVYNMTATRQPSCPLLLRERLTALTAELRNFGIRRPAFRADNSADGGSAEKLRAQHDRDPRRQATHQQYHHDYRHRIRHYEKRLVVTNSLHRRYHTCGPPAFTIPGSVLKRPADCRNLLRVNPRRRNHEADTVRQSKNRPNTCTESD